MALTLQTYLTKPLEREYEAWFVTALEAYFEAKGRDFRIWAVSPSDESTWPADEHLSTEEKLVGLQFKQAKLALPEVPDPDFDRLNWTFSQPSKQFELIQRCPEIFYCLPTFLNRKWKEAVLDHSILWRPEPGDEVNYNAWYNNPAARTPYKALNTHFTALRWGEFYEKLLACQAGIVLSGNRSLTRYLQALRSLLQELETQPEGPIEEVGYAERSPLYLLGIGIG